MAMAVSSSTVLRVRGLPSNQNIDEITTLLERSLQIRSEAFGLKITSLAEDPYQVKKQVATLVFSRQSPSLFNEATTKEWSITVPKATDYPGSGEDLVLTFDTHFRGLTALNTPSKKEEVIDCVAVCGLGGHAFGSFKEKGTSYMWLRDTLPKDLPNLRVLLYGYESGLEESDSSQNISVIADSFVSHLSFLRPRSKTISTPLVIIAHSLGGLVIKQALIKLDHGSESDRKQMESIVGLLFFGVPNRGMDIESLQAIVGDKQNRYLLESVGQYSEILLQQDGQFGSVFHFEETRVISFFETKSSPTAIKVNGSWKMAGPKKILVNRFSATRPRLQDSRLRGSDEEIDEGFDRTHSDLVKFSANDVDYQRVLRRLKEVTSEATKKITLRYLSQESPESLDADENACLRSLSFTEIYARESTIEPAVQGTGNWLLESQNFQDWSQRRKLHEHRGFFWIQGNPGSGKSTLMKRIYSHVRACEKDPSSVIAAFFFNARGTEIEKSPTGLLRTLLHTLCQRIAALRSIVVKAYTAKNRLVKSGWQWQISELKEFLGAATKSSVLGQRSLVLFIDALDECDWTATQSVISVFENLARSSFSEGTTFNICLSSRYWPQIRIQHCFVARVELENKGDIARYIRGHLDSAQTIEDLEVLSLLERELLDKAKGTFLWVVLVIRDLLNASVSGATLREFRKIVQRVPQDLREFYQHQLQSTESEDRDHILRLLQIVFYAQRPLSPTELRYALAFGCGAFASYAEWSQSSEYVRSDEQTEKRIREHSKGLIEIARLPGNRHFSDDNQSKAQSRNEVVQFTHQSVRDFLEADGFSFLRDSRRRTNDADGHEFLKTACWNYLKIKDFEAMSMVNLRVYEQFKYPKGRSELKAAHPFLEYMVRYIFPHAAQAEQHGISQDYLRTHICSDRGCFERWRCLHDAVIMYGGRKQGPEARPIHIFAQYGLLTRDIAERETKIDIAGGTYGSALTAACSQGHQDAVKMLLDVGADPKFDARCRVRLHDPLIVEPWHQSMAPLSSAISSFNLPLLRQLLNNQRSILTLPEKLELCVSINEEPYHSDLEAVLAMLFPEAAFPDSAMDDFLYRAHYFSPKVFSFLLDRFDESIVHDEMLWHVVFRVLPVEGIVDKVTALLDRGGRVTITGAIVNRLSKGANVDKVFSFLLEHCDVEMTEDLLNAISSFLDSAQIQLLLALKFGSPETAAFFLERQAGNTSTDEMLQSAMNNYRFPEQVTLLLLGHLNLDCINEQAVITALEYRYYGGNLIRLLHDRWSSLPFSEAALETAVRNQGPDVVKLVLESLEGVKITEKILTAAAANGELITELLLLHDPDVRIKESTVVGAIRNKYIGPSILQVFCRHKKPLLCTELVVEAAATVGTGPDALDIILKQEHIARISSSMVMEAMRANQGAALISVMLDHDDTIDITEKHLVAAASNSYDPITIFALLQTKGKLNNAKLTSGVPNGHRAKRRRTSHQSLPGISTKVINAAFSNPVEGLRLRLLELFLEWSIITQAEFDSRS